MREEDIKKAIKESEKPSTKIYLAVLVVIVAFLAFYFVVLANNSNLSFWNEKITSPEQAQSISNNISKGIQDVSSNINDIGNTLGIS